MAAESRGTFDEAVELDRPLTCGWVVKRAIPPPLHAIGAVPLITECFDGGLLNIQVIEGGDNRHKVEHGFGDYSWDRCRPYVVDLADRGDMLLKPHRLAGRARRP